MKNNILYILLIFIACDDSNVKPAAHEPVYVCGEYSVKIVEIGAWNADKNSSVQVVHGLVDHTTIRSVSAIMISDLEAYTNLNHVSTNGEVSGNVARWDGSKVTLLRTDIKH